MIEWFISGNWHDWKYMITVPLCLGVGHLVGWMRCKEYFRKLMEVGI